MSNTDPRLVISSIEEIIEDAKMGKMFVLVDHEDRENEGDLVIPAQMANPEAINFMAKYGRGLICLALTGERVDHLKLPLMSSYNSSRHETAFTISIEAREGVTTGISAHDRAHTVAVAIGHNRVSSDIATPGHVFPLRARDGGVLVRAGHTEAAVDISRLAGLNPSGVICEIMNDDGTMSRLPDLIDFAKKHELRIGTISDLISYRRRHDNLVTELSNKIVSSIYGGDWNMRTFKDETYGETHVVLTKGILDKKRPDIIYMNMVEGSLTYLNNEKLIINSEEAIFNKDNFKTIFTKNVKLIYQGQILKSDILEFLIDKNIAIFKDNVKYYNQDIEAFADIVNINLLTKEIDIKSKNQKKIKIKKNN